MWVSGCAWSARSPEVTGALLDGSPVTGAVKTAVAAASRFVADGGLSLLRQARALGDELVACLNSDESVRRRKGPSRPIVPVAGRIALLAQLRPDVWSRAVTTPSVICPRRRWSAGTAGGS